MKTERAVGVRRASVRVAVITTAIVAIIYLAIAAVLVVIVDRDLTGSIDGRLDTALGRIVADRPKFIDNGFSQPAGGPRFAAPLLVWTIHPDHTVTNTDTTAVLPVAARHVSAPETVDLDGTDVRIMGTQVDDEYVVVGQTMEGVAQARSTVIVAEVLVGPILLLCVFLGALTIGRRVAAPVEFARRRQLEFTADASHELRTPLSVIEAQTALALLQKRDTAWYRQGFQRVDVEAKRMHRLVDDMLWLARFDAAASQPRAEPVDVAAVAAQAVDRFATVAEARRLTLSVRVTGGPTVITAPPDWLDRLLGVLLDNACKYSPEEGSVEVAVGGYGGRVRLCIDDTGPGIPAEERPRIFDRFRRATDRPGGAGLGLAMADAVVRATNGRWEVASSPSGGASMAVVWPRATGGSREAAGSPPPVMSPSRRAEAT